MVLSYSGMVVVAVEMLAVGPISSRLSVHMVSSPLVQLATTSATHSCRPLAS